MQGKPNKTKENCLDFLGFLWPNRDFSMCYSKSKIKNSFRISSFHVIHQAGYGLDPSYNPQGVISIQQ
jgi:hypothetical protein